MKPPELRTETRKTSPWWIIEDVREAVVSVLAHRIELKPSVKYSETAKEYLEREMQEQFGAASGEYG